MDFYPNRKLLQLIAQDPSNILLVKDSLVTPQMWRYAIEQDPTLFQYIKNPSPDLCEFAVEESGENLKWVYEHNPDAITSEMCYTAIDSYPSAILHVPSELCDYPMKEYAIDLDPTLVQAFSDLRPAYIQEKLRVDPNFCRFLKNPTEEMEYKAVENDANYCAYVKHFTPRIKRLIETLYPEIIELLPNFNKVDDYDGYDD